MISSIIIIFILGYLGIALEHSIKVNKAAIALITGVLIWTIYIMGAADVVPLLHSESFQFFLHEHPQLQSASLLEQAHSFITSQQIVEHLGDIAGTLFFLIGAMTIVEIIDSHHGFEIITNRIKTRNKHRLLWLITFITFFMSAILDNMTTSIVMVMLVRGIIRNYKERWIYACIIIIAANSGGAWSPIGDITTIMLWMGGNVTTSGIIPGVFLASLVSAVVPAFIANRLLHGVITENAQLSGGNAEFEINEIITRKERKSIFYIGVACLVATPIFKTVTHLPPYMGILLGLGVLWVYTEIMYRRKKGISEDEMMRVPDVLRKIDIPTILFFLGILLAVAGLQSTGILNNVATFLDEKLHNVYLINLIIGVISSIVDNVPLVAGAIGMYPIMDAAQLANVADPAYMSHFVVNGTFWEFLAYCAGVGGSILIIGSAAGVVVMGIERIPFVWYLKNISLMALTGYLAGALVYVLQVYI